MEQFLNSGHTQRLIKHSFWLLLLGVVVGYIATKFAGASAGNFDPVSISAGDTAWMLASTALVMIMTPAVGFFYGGMVPVKNVLSVIKQSMVILALVSIQWVLIGYSLSFGTDIHGLIGGLNFFGLRGVGFAPNPDYAVTIPQLVYMAFQAMFAIVTPALIIGAFVGRIRFKTLVIFTILWTTLVYDPVAHWVWSPLGWLHALGALDFAGGTVVHMTAGFSALAAAALTWVALSWAENKKPSAIAGAIGAVCGLVVITPASGYVGPMASIAIGIIGGVVTYGAVYIRNKKIKIDDTLDVWAGHGVGGLTGAILTGFFAEKAINSAGNNGLLFGNPHQLWVQIIAVAATGIYSFLMTWVILKVLEFNRIPLRVSSAEEKMGLDLAVHGEAGYKM